MRIGSLGWGCSLVTAHGGLNLASNEITDALFLIPFPSPQHSLWIIPQVLLEKGKPSVPMCRNLPHCDHKKNSKRGDLGFMWVCCRRVLV